MTRGSGTTFAVLGTVEVRGPGGVVAVGRPGQRALLALLLARANQVLGPDEIVRQLWGDQPPATARAQVHALVSAVRQAVPDGRRLLRTHAGGYRLAVEPGALDLFRFERGLAHAAEEPDKARAAAAFRAALALWRGTPFTGIEAVFVDRVRRRLGEQRLHAVERVTDLELALGRHGELVGELTELVGAHPERERLHRQLMLALHRDGRTAEAMAAYRACRKALADAGIGPSPELGTLAERMLNTDDTLLAGTEKGTENSAENGREKPPSLLPPAPGTRGSTEHHAALDELLSGTEPRIAAIHGPAGGAASALAVGWAHTVADRFTDGVLYVDLAATPEPADALAGLLAHLGVTEHPDEVAERAALFRSTVHDRHLLLLLDNARDTAQVRHLLPGTNTCAVVVTSRDRLAGLVAAVGARRLTIR